MITTVYKVNKLANLNGNTSAEEVEGYAITTGAGYVLFNSDIKYALGIRNILYRKLLDLEMAVLRHVKKIVADNIRLKLSRVIEIRLEKQLPIAEHNRLLDNIYILEEMLHIYLESSITHRTMKDKHIALFQLFKYFKTRIVELSMSIHVFTTIMNDVKEKDHKEVFRSLDYDIYHIHKVVEGNWQYSLFDAKIDIADNYNFKG